MCTWNVNYSCASYNLSHDLSILCHCSFPKQLFSNFLKYTTGEESFLLLFDIVYIQVHDIMWTAWRWIGYWLFLRWFWCVMFGWAGVDDVRAECDRNRCRLWWLRWYWRWARTLRFWRYKSDNFIISTLKERKNTAMQLG